MSRGYSATPVWGLSRNSAVAAFFVKISRLRIEGLLNPDKRQQISKTIKYLYVCISRNCAHLQGPKAFC